MRLASAVFLLALLPAACSRGRAAEGGSAADVLAFVQAGSRGDVEGQLALLARREDANPLGARVLRELHDPRDLVFYDARSVQLYAVRNDTAWWGVWGMGPDRSRLDLGGWETVNGTPQPRTSPPTDAELLALPRVRSERQYILVRGPDGWKLPPLSSARVGPVLLGLDSLDARCPYGEDARPCRALADRLVRMLDSLPPVPRQRWSYLAPRATHRIRTAQAWDSLRLEVLNVRGNPYLLQTGVEVAVVNRSAVPLSAFFRLLDAEGSVLVDLASVSGLPAHGRKEVYVTVEGRSFPRPVRAELVSVYPDDGG